VVNCTDERVSGVFIDTFSQVTGEHMHYWKIGLNYESGYAQMTIEKLVLGFAEVVNSMFAITTRFFGQYY